MSNIDTIKTEIDTDPLARGYSGMTDQQVADDLNTVYRQRNRTSMSGREVADEIVDAEYDALSDAKKAQLLSLGASDSIDPFGFGANVIKDIFTAGSTTVSNLAAARVETISRAEELGIGTVKTGWVEEARRQ